MKKLIALILAALLALACAASAETAEPAYGFRGDETVEERLVYDENGVKLTVVGLGIVLYYPMLKLRVENASGEPLTFDLAEIALNDWMWDAYLCLYEDAGEDSVYEEVSDLTVEDGAALDFGLGFSNEYYYELCGITGFGEIGFTLRARDPNSGDIRFVTPSIDVATSLGADYPGLYQDIGTLAYDKDGVRILIPGLCTNDYGSTSVLVYVNNYSDRPVIVSADNCAVNGEAAQPWFNAEVFPGRQCLAEMGFGEDIPDIRTLNTAFRVDAFDPSTMDEPTNIDVSDAVEVEF